MKIKNIKVWSADLGNTKPYTIAFKTVDEVLNAFVEITLENGITGIGAGNPSEYVTGESFEHCKQALQEKNIQFLLGRDIREVHQLAFEVWQKLPANPAARGYGKLYQFKGIFGCDERFVCRNHFPDLPGQGPGFLHLPGLQRLFDQLDVEVFGAIVKRNGL
jgi:hypothetical protein